MEIKYSKKAADLIRISLNIFDSSTQYLHSPVPKLKEPDLHLAVLLIVVVAAHELCLKCSSDHGHMGVLHEFAD